MRKLAQPCLARLRCAGLILIVILLGAACSPQPAPATLAPSVTPLPPTPTAPAPTAALTSAPAASPTLAPSDTPEPPATSAVTAAATAAATAAPTGSPAPTETSAATPLPEADSITFQIRNATDNILYVFGYGVSKSIPSGMTVYFPAPAWGSVTLRICHQNKNDELGGCYLYTGTISASQPLIMVRR